MLNGDGINLDYAYAFTGRRANSAYIILRVDQPDKAAALLAGAGVHLVSQDELNEL